MDFSIDWYKERVVVDAGNQAYRELVALAHEIEGQAKINVRENDQIDTGFMLNSIHVVTRDRAGWDLASRLVRSRDWSEKRQRYVDHSGDMANDPPLPDRDSVGVVASAIYSIYQEMRRSFLYAAACSVASAHGAIVKVRKS